MEVTFITYVEDRNFLSVGDYIDLVHVESFYGKILNITQVCKVKKSDLYRVVGVARYLVGNEAENCVTKYHARELR